MNKEKIEEIYVKPENRMSEVEMSAAGFGNSENTQPVIEMVEGKKIPVYIFGGPLVMRSPLGDAHMDIMITVMHHIKEKKLELRGRIRYKDTGRKTVFSFPKTFDAKQYEDARQEARNMYLKLIKDSPFKPLEVPWELEIPKNASVKEVIRLMDESNHFNIGIPEKK